VERGTGVAVAVITGLKTYLGSISSALVSREVKTSYDKGVTQFTWLMIRFILVMVPLVFIINGLTKHNWQEAFYW
jgi:P-type Mg2+ transporter